jgi:hypothetical protein
LIRANAAIGHSDSPVEHYQARAERLQSQQNQRLQHREANFPLILLRKRNRNSSLSATQNTVIGVSVDGKFQGVFGSWQSSCVTNPGGVIEAVQGALKAEAGL